jgi:hypothetical protein
MGKVPHVAHFGSRHYSGSSGRIGGCYVALDSKAGFTRHPYCLLPAIPVSVEEAAEMNGLSTLRPSSGNYEASLLLLDSDRSLAARDRFRKQACRLLACTPTKRSSKAEPLVRFRAAHLDRSAPHLGARTR